MLPNQDTIRTQQPSGKNVDRHEDILTSLDVHSNVPTQPATECPADDFIVQVDVANVGETGRGLVPTFTAL